VDSAERDYFAKAEADLARDLAEAEAAEAALAQSVPAWRDFALAPEDLARRVVLFARGGYGRAELTFGSDLDTGWCVDQRGLRTGHADALRELVLRAEALLNRAGIATVHQYFEIDEDLSRFAEPRNLHTIPSVLESRALAGNAELLGELQRRFRAVLPADLYLRQKLREYESSPRPGLTAMDLKQDHGGLRSIQVPLWILAVLHPAPSLMTAALLEQARGLGFLSVYEAARLLAALEFLHELRNFSAAAEAHYYDQEARDSNCIVTEFPENGIHDALARLYLFRKTRFASVDAFDAYRLRIVSDAEALSRVLLDRVLDRTQIHRLGNTEAAVHLGRKQITALSGVSRALPGAVSALFPTGHAVLRLAAFIAETGYDLSPELKDALAEVVLVIAPARDAASLAAQAADWARVMTAPHAQVALAALWSVQDALAPGVETLLGRFMPEMNRMVFLLRGVQAGAQPMHRHVLASLARGQEALDALRDSHPELHALLGPPHVLAVKFSLLLHSACALEGTSENPARSAEMAAEIVARLGFAEADLERRVRLLVEHHKAVVALAKSASYADQALAEYFELADRDIVNVVLLYLVNVAVLRATGERFQADLRSLADFFEEASRIFAELRGLPSRDRSRALINTYLGQRKEEVKAETRVHLLLQRSYAQGVAGAMLEPLTKAQPEEAARLRPRLEELAALQREILLGSRAPGEQARLEGKFIQLLRQHLGGAVLGALTRDQDAVFTWFFCAFPNRYLLGSPPARLAAQMAKFARFGAAPVLVDLVAPEGEGAHGLLIATRLPGAHARVAYALSRRRVNIVLGKVNRVGYQDGGAGDCYYFQITPLGGAEPLSARDLELLIENQAPPDLSQPPPASPYQRRGVRVEFLGVDPEAYQVEPVEGGFVRKARPLGRIRVVMRDQPFLFFKVTQVFERFKADIRQAIVTTTGNQVQDYFYISPEDYERLRASTFEEFLINRMSAELVESVA
jgi:UTP:GlnB (protein PII) uridylyltransferase